MSTPPGTGDLPPRHNLHRGGLADDPARLRPHPTLFARIGGRAVVARIIDTFYDRVQADPLLGPLFNHSERHNIVARDRQRRFFEEWLGGAARYKNDEARPPMQGLQRRHYPFPITAQSAGRWLHHMSASLRECGIGPDIVSEIMGRLAPMARRMVNEEEQAPSGANPMRQRQMRTAAAWKLAARGDRDGLRPLIERDPGPGDAALNRRPHPVVGGHAAGTPAGRRAAVRAGRRCQRPRLRPDVSLPLRSRRLDAGDDYALLPRQMARVRRPRRLPLWPKARSLTSTPPPSWATYRASLRCWTPARSW